ncbi:MAG: hypothetical protein ACRDNL_28765, partial [Spirillospora sp.]
AHRAHRAHRRHACPSVRPIQEHVPCRTRSASEARQRLQAHQACSPRRDRPSPTHRARVLQPGHHP